MTLSFKAAFDRKRRSAMVVEEVRASAGLLAEPKRERQKDPAATGEAVSRGTHEAPQLPALPRTPSFVGATSPQSLALTDADFVAAWGQVVSTESAALCQYKVVPEAKRRF